MTGTDMAKTTFSPLSTPTTVLRRLVMLVLLAMVGLALAAPAGAEVTSNIRNTKHNLGSGSGNTVRATGEDEVCVFCHTPHAATTGTPSPLWNRSLPSSSQLYDHYQSSSMEATGLGQPGGSSKLCLSCHDGTMAIGSVNVLNGSANGTIAMQGTDAGKMPAGSGADTGFTRRIGTDLTNDHPISFAYNTALASADGELRDPAASSGLIANRVVGVKPTLPLEDNQLQCTTCHDPHLSDSTGANIKFLRLNRFQVTSPGVSYDQGNDIICLGCHTKAGWKDSAHADFTVANETYTLTASQLREFPDSISVGQAACLNCHDTHTVKGARRLLREGTDSIASPKSGGNSAIEQTCYQCHASGGILSSATQVPNVKTDFDSTYHMPIARSPEVHDIGTGSGSQRGKDFIEDPVLLGLANRHVECTDCHNPHRVRKNRLFTGTGTTTAGTHDHAAGHTNIASGVLRGSWGVEPSYGSSTWGTVPTYTVKKGDPGASASTAKAEAYVTREYQVCLKCHSSYAYGSTPPSPDGLDGGTPSGVNSLTQYTDQAMEFQAPLGDTGEPGGNHRSWHPVIEPTGRSATTRNANRLNWKAPWNAAADVGSQTMYCSDCHGNATASGTVVPSGGEDGNPWGPHGSTQPFILKGSWTNLTGEGTSDHLCFKCHEYDQYANGDPATKRASGFGGSKDSNLHYYHANKLSNFRCTYCHVAVPHGWKNKALLVDLNNVDGVQVRNNTTSRYYKSPYYNGAVLKVITFATSGSWEEGNCGSKGAPGNGDTGRDWMRDSNENCKNPP